MPSASPTPQSIDFGWGEALASGTYTFLAVGVSSVPEGLQEQVEGPSDLRRTIGRISQASQEHGKVVFATNLPRCQIVLAYTSAWQAVQSIHDYYSDPEAELVSIGLCVGSTFEGDDPTTCVPLLKAQNLSELALPGQVLLSASTFEVLRDGAPVEWEFEDLGTIHLDFQMRRERVIQLLHPLLPSIRAFLHVEERVRPALPHRFGLLIGRDGLVDDIIGRVGRFPIVTLTGPTGIGKSHLASKIAYELQTSDEDVVWVNLTGVEDEAKFFEHVAQALGLRGKNFPLRNLILRQLSGRRIRIILDGCETCRDIASGFATEATRSNSGPSFLITSAKRLGIENEEQVFVSLLPTPPIDVIWSDDDLEEHPATALFMDRAREANPDFRATSTEAQAVAKICNHFGGHPLSILLAAKKVSQLSPSQILFELTSIHGKPNRKKTAASGKTRHDSLQLAFDWTYFTISPEAQHLARALVPMKGRWQKSIASALADIPEERARDPLAELVDVGFVELDKEISYGDYYIMPANVSNYLNAKFESEEDRLETFERHCIIHLQLLAKLGKDLGEQDEISALDKFEEHKQDVLAALEFTIRTGEEVSTLANALFQSWRYWYMRNHILECLSIVDLACRRYKGPSTLDLGRIVNLGAALAIKRGLASKAERYLSKARRIANIIKNERLFCVVYSNFGYLYWSTGQFRKSVIALEIAERYLNEDTDLSNRATLYSSLFNCLLDDGQIDRAEITFHKAKEILGDAPAHQLRWSLLIGKGQLVLRRGNPQEALTIFKETLIIADRTNDRASYVLSIYWLAESHFAAGSVERATQYLGAMKSAIRAHDIALYPINELRINRLWQKCQSLLPNSAFNHELMLGALQDLDSLIDEGNSTIVA